MLKLKKNRHEKHSDPELDISSLIDVSFLLLIFFLVTSTLLKRESDLAMKLPEPNGKVSDPIDALLIDIAGNGTITVGGQEMAGPSEQGEASQINEVRLQLTEHKTRADLLGQQALVSISASGEANTQRFVDVLNALAFAGIDRIALQDDLAAN